MVIPPALLARLRALCEADPEREVCGFLLRGGGGGGGEALEVRAIPNVADRYLAADPQHFPRGSRTSYLMDPKAQLAVHRELEASGGTIAAVWHSHVEVGAYFSAKDRADAVIAGAPAIPGAVYLVLGVAGGRVTEVKQFEWSGSEFIETSLSPLVPGAAGGNC